MESATSLLSEYIETIEKIDSRPDLQNEFANDAEIIEYTTESCECREPITVKRWTTYSNKRVSPTDYKNWLSQSKGHPDRRFEDDWIPDELVDKEIIFVEPSDQIEKDKCNECKGYKKVDCGCGDGWIDCSNCEGEGMNDCPRCFGDGDLTCPDCDDGWMSCPSCSAILGPSTEDCGNCTDGTVKCENTACRSGRIDCNHPDCQGGKVSCEKCKGGQVKCGICNGEREHDCFSCSGTGQEVLCDHATTGFHYEIGGQEVATKEGMPRELIADFSPQNKTLKLTRTDETGDGAVMSGYRRWQAPTSRIKYKMAGREFTLHRIGTQWYDNNKRPPIVDRTADTRTRQIGIGMGIVAGIAGLAFVAPISGLPRFELLAVLGAILGGLLAYSLRHFQTIETPHPNTENFLHNVVAIPMTALYGLGTMGDGSRLSATLVESASALGENFVVVGVLHLATLAAITGSVDWTTRNSISKHWLPKIAGCALTGLFIGLIGTGLVPLGSDTLLRNTAVFILAFVVLFLIGSWRHLLSGVYSSTR